MHTRVWKCLICQTSCWRSTKCPWCVTYPSDSSEGCFLRQNAERSRTGLRHVRPAAFPTFNAEWLTGPGALIGQGNRALQPFKPLSRKSSPLLPWLGALHLRWVNLWAGLPLLSSPWQTTLVLMAKMATHVYCRLEKHVSSPALFIYLLFIYLSREGLHNDNEFLSLVVISSNHNQILHIPGSRQSAADSNKKWDRETHLLKEV